MLHTNWEGSRLPRGLFLPTEAPFLPTEAPLRPTFLGLPGCGCSRLSPSPWPRARFVSLCGQGRGGGGGDRWAQPAPLLPGPGGVFLRRSRGTGGEIVLCKFQYLYAGAAVRMNARNNYQIMHVELVFLNPKPLKGKATTQQRAHLKQKEPRSSDPKMGGGLLPRLRVSLGVLREIK